MWIIQGKFLWEVPFCNEFFHASSCFRICGLALHTKDVKRSHKKKRVYPKLGDPKGHGDSAHSFLINS